MKTQKNLITGRAGLGGSNLAHRLLGTSKQVSDFRKATCELGWCPQIGIQAGADHFLGSIRDNHKLFGPL